MIKHLTIAFMLMCCTSMVAQLPTKTSPIGFMAGDSIIRILPTQTQTEVKPGVSFVDRFKTFNKKTKSKAVRYLWGAHAKQSPDTQRPCFYIDPESSQVIDFAIVRLDTHKEYRRFKKAELRKNTFQTFDMFFADVKLLEDDNYIVTPKEPLAAGEYVIVQLSQQPLNEEGDLIVYPFSIDDVPASTPYKQNY